MNRRDFLRASAGAAAGLLLGCGSRSALGRRRPNLILIVSDALRADHLGCYGSPMSLSPTLDGLARRGALFADVMSCAPVTAASHATLMTGTYQTRHGVVGNSGSIDGGLITLAEVLRDAGYETAAFVSNTALKPGNLGGTERGFDPYNVELPTVERNRPLIYYRLAPETSAAALSWLEQRRGVPFFLWVHYLEPHGPYEVADPALLGEIQDLPRVEGEPSALPVLSQSYQPHGIPAYQVLGDERTPRQYRLRYAARVRYVDGYVGQLINAVGRLDLEDDTFIVFTSDHGELLGEHEYYFMHGVTLLQPVLAVPLIVAGPGVGQGRRIMAPVSNTDVMPTALDVLGIRSDAVAEQLQGHSLAPMLRGESGEPRPIYALSTRSREWSVRTGQLKYTTSEDHSSGREGLFDLTEDPGEQHDVSGSRRQEAGRLGDLLQEFTATNPRVFDASPSRAPRLSREDRERLKALGYL